MIYFPPHCNTEEREKEGKVKWRKVEKKGKENGGKRKRKMEE